MVRADSRPSSSTRRAESTPFAAAPTDGSAGLGANFGPKYEQHISQMQQSLEDAQQRLEQMQKAADELK